MKITHNKINRRSDSYPLFLDYITNRWYPAKTFEYSESKYEYVSTRNLNEILKGHSDHFVIAEAISTI